ncbi:MAG TPA: sensor histidine kinase, partial [Rheinheimera sp.]|nr:sensor histidine kinase [Rheinheimera sp.]
LQSALRNILDNASKYADADSCVTISAVIEASVSLALTVQNQCLTMPDLQRMGNRFFRHQSHQHIDGSGLGLSITQRIIELHGGTVQFTLPQANQLRVILHLPTAST